MKADYFLAAFLSVSLAVGWVGPARAVAAKNALAAGQSNAPSETEIRALADRVIEAQHRDDLALEEYERFEHRVTRTGSDRRVAEDKTYRVVPTGTGTLRMLVKNGTSPVDAASYRKQLRDWEQVLEIACNPQDSREQAAYEKSQKRLQQRNELVETTRRAFRATWGGHETRNGRLLDILVLEPNLDFQPRSTAEDVLIHARAKIWIDDSSGHLVRGEADIIRDVYFGAGFLGKLYRGSHFVLENGEVAPDVWLPSRIQFDFSGRKFLFSFEEHDVTEITRYRRIGPPAHALALVQDELAHGGSLPGDP